VDVAFQTTNYVRCGALLTGTPGSTGGLPFNGSMDEARIENGVRSPAWVYASWATVANPAFASYGGITFAPVTLASQFVNAQLVLSWPAGTLQSAPAATGLYTDLTGVTSPYTNTPAADQQYFRIKVQ
jgi:hypothetical protein